MARSSDKPTVAQSWSRLDRWLRRHLPEVVESLRPGAAESDIHQAERAMGRELPQDVRESYGIHDGQAETSTTGCIYGLPLLPLSFVVQHWRSWQEYTCLNDKFRANMRSYPSEAIQSDYANPGWIPLTYDFSGNYIGADLSPAAAGSLGQVITFGRDEDSKYVVATSWREFLTDIVEQLESGNFTINAEQQLGIKRPRVAHYYSAIAQRYRKRGV